MLLEQGSDLGVGDGALHEGAALAAGLAYARQADAIVTMDADLQDPPEVIPQLLAAWRAGAEIVRATRRTRAETGLRRVGFNVFHGVFGRLSDFPMSPNSGTFGLIGHDAIEAFHQFPERHRFFPGLRAWIGFPTTDVLYDREERAAGQPQQTLRQLVRYALDGLNTLARSLREVTTPRFRLAALGRRANTPLDMILEDHDRDRVDGGPQRRRLLQDVDAVLLALDHPRDVVGPLGVPLLPLRDQRVVDQVRDVVEKCLKPAGR